MSNPLVSIVIPVYNGSNYMREAIDSALAQTYSPIEIIVVNDGSTDGGATEEIALSYGDKIRYFHKENGGTATALNFGIGKMKSDYFSWLSHDDYYLPERTEKVMAKMLSGNPLEEIVYTDFLYLDDETKKTHYTMVGQRVPEKQLSSHLYMLFLNVISYCTLIVPRSLFEEYSFFKEEWRYTHDYANMFEILSNKKFVYLPEALFVSRRHSDQVGMAKKAVREETGRLFLDVAKKSDEKEMTAIYGHLGNFYLELYNRSMADGMHSLWHYAQEKLSSLPFTSTEREQLKHLKEAILDANSCKGKEICIFGAGRLGQKVHMYLESKLVAVDYFCDNALACQNTKIKGIPCISPQELAEKKEDVLVIVAMLKSEEVLNQLQDLEIPYVTTKKDIDGILLQYPVAPPFFQVTDKFPETEEDKNQLFKARKAVFLAYDDLAEP